MRMMKKVLRKKEEKRGVRKKGRNDLSNKKWEKKGAEKIGRRIPYKREKRKKNLLQK